QYSRRARIAQSSALPTVADEPASPVRDDREDVATTQSGDYAPIKGRSINEGEEAAERIMVSFPLLVYLLLSFPLAVKELEEQQEKEDKRMNEQIARDEEVARIHAEEELQRMIRQSQQRRPMTKKQNREYYMAMIRNNLGWKVKDFKGMTFKEIKAKFAEVWKQVEDFIPMGSKEETKRIKRKGLNLEQEQVKKQKSSEEAPEIETSTEEFTEEKVNEMMQLVPVEDVYVQAL
nr:hypothetical protein [Tanacetum cinerariifolium]